MGRERLPGAFVKELMTDSGDKLSSTKAIKWLGFFALLVVLLYSVYLNRDYVPELFSTFAFFCGGLTVTKGMADAYKEGVK